MNAYKKIIERAKTPSEVSLALREQRRTNACFSGLFPEAQSLIVRPSSWKSKEETGRIFCITGSFNQMICSG